MPLKIINKVIIAATTAILAAFLFEYGNTKNTFYGDALGYYMYLPAACINGNVRTPYDPIPQNIFWGITWSLEEMKKNANAQGYYLNQYTYGTALMEAPFFFIAHTYEKLKRLPANGYSDTYNYLIKASSLFYALIGSYLIYRILKKYFSATLSLIGAVLILLCTNLFWFSVFQAGMAHVPLFFLYALLMYITMKLHERPTPLLFLLTGFIAGIITLIRPSDILCLLIPLLYGIYNRAGIRDRIHFIKTYKRYIFIAAIAFIVPVIPQLFYWKAVTGSYFSYSYGSQSFNWSDPKIIEGLFYCSNGWLPYTPVMIFALIGIGCYKYFRDWLWCILLLLPAYIYIIYSWYCYYYLNGFGSRPMIHMYPLLALPLTAFLQYIADRGVLLKSVFTGLFIFMVAVNFSYSIQQSKGIIDSAESNMAFNLQMLFQSKLQYKNLYTKDVGEIQPDSSRLTKCSTLACQDYEDSTSDHYVRDTTGHSRYVYHMKDQDYIEVATIKYDKQKFKGAKWFKCSGRFLCTEHPDYYKHLLVLDINDKKKLWRGCQVENKITGLAGTEDLSNVTFDRGVLNKWGYVTYYAHLPWNLKNGDAIKLIMWITNKHELYMDDLCLELYK